MVPSSAGALPREVSTTSFVSVSSKPRMVTPGSSAERTSLPVPVSRTLIFMRWASTL